MLRTIPLQNLTSDAFRPFGTLVAVPDGASSMASEFNASWRLPFACSGAEEIAIIRFPYRPIRFSLFERHHHVTQTYVALSGQPSVFVVAAPTPRRDAPDPDSVTAFLFKPGDAVILKRGTWHTLGRFPIASEESTALMITERETTEDLIHATALSRRAQRSDLVDLKAVIGMEFGVTLAVEDASRVS